MMKAFWTGTISFGLVSVAVKAYGATQDHGLETHQVHAHCPEFDAGDDEKHGRIAWQRVCKTCTADVAYTDIATGHVSDFKRMTVLSPEDLDGLPGVKTREISIMEFVDPDEIDPLRYGTPYYLRADLGQRKRDDRPRPNRPYVLLVEALRESGLVAVGRVVFRSRETLVELSVRDDMLIMRTIRWADEIKEPVFTNEPVHVPDVVTTDAERREALRLIDAMTVKWDGDRHTDQREVALAALIASRQPVVEPVDTGAQVIELFGRLTQRGQAS